MARSIAAASFLLSAATACSGAGQQSAPLAQTGFSATPAIATDAAAAQKPAGLLFAADQGGRSGGGAVYAYLNSGTGQSPLWSLGAPLSRPSALWVDGSRNLYVADAAGYVYEFAAPTASGPPGKPLTTYVDAGETPNAVATCGDYVYASNQVGNGSNQSFTVWTKGVSSPLRVVSYPGGGGSGQGITCNAAGDVFFSYQLDDNGGAAIDRYGAGGTGSPTRLPMQPVSTLSLTLSKAGLLVLCNPDNPSGPDVEFYQQTRDAPSHSLRASWLSLPFAIAYEKGDKALWIADLGNASLYRVAPSKGTLLNTITAPGFKTLDGVAVSPPDHP